MNGCDANYFCVNVCTVMTCTYVLSQDGWWAVKASKRGTVLLVRTMGCRCNGLAQNPGGSSAKGAWLVEFCCGCRQFKDRFLYPQKHCPFMSEGKERDGLSVFVPLCGKTLDMVWLCQQGHTVVGCELSEIAALDFFKENSIPYETRESSMNGP